MPPRRKGQVVTGRVLKGGAVGKKELAKKVEEKKGSKKAEKKKDKGGKGSVNTQPVRCCVSCYARIAC
eukprot:1288474-Rhodomonas_salina.1